MTKKGARTAERSARSFASAMAHTGTRRLDLKRRPAPLVSSFGTLVRFQHEKPDLFRDPRFACCRITPQQIFPPRNNHPECHTEKKRVLFLFLASQLARRTAQCAYRLARGASYMPTTENRALHSLNSIKEFVEPVGFRCVPGRLRTSVSPHDAPPSPERNDASDSPGPMQGAKKNGVCGNISPQSIAWSCQATERRTIMHTPPIARALRFVYK